MKPLDSVVLALLKASTYDPGKSCSCSSGWAGEKGYASAFRSLRPCCIGGLTISPE